MKETSFSQLLAGFQPSSGGEGEVEIPADWMQGRTTYGGLTAAISFKAAERVCPDLPVRSAQIAFIGPVGGAVSVSSSLLRRGKNSAFVGVDVTGEGNLAARCLFAFGKTRTSDLAHQDMPMPHDLPAPEGTTALFPDGGMRPNFTRHFNMRLAEGALPMSGGEAPLLGLWLRHKDRAAEAGPATVLAIADAPPPAAITMFQRPGAISSMTWMAEFVGDPSAATAAGWYYARHSSETIKDGYAAQSMSLWTEDGAPCLIGRQTVAVFV
ncbi:MAG: thioesterase family protein [Pseudomonadota bacterium]